MILLEIKMGLFSCFFGFRKNGNGPYKDILKPWTEKNHAEKPHRRITVKYSIYSLLVEFF